MLIYDNTYETNENKVEPRIKLNYNIYKRRKYNTKFGIAIYLVPADFMA